MMNVPTLDGTGTGEGIPARHILLAEDQPVNQRVAKAMLEHLGFAVDVVPDGAKAVDAAFRTSYQAILMDCQIPVMDGYRATAEIRCLQGDLRHTPIIAVTASTTKGDQERCLDAGMDDYLTKPISLKALATVLALWAPEAPAAPADPSNLDSKVIERLERLGEAVGEDLLTELVGLFQADAEALILALHAGLAADDAVAVSGTAHALRGSSANLGAPQLASLCALLEADAEDGDLASAGTLLEAIEEEFASVRAAFHARVRTS